MTIRRTLDCESLESATESLCRLLCVTPNELSSHVKDFVENPLEIRTNQVEDRWLPMLNQVAGREIHDVEQGATMWFHATRVHDFESFRSGLLTVREQMEATWRLLYTLVSDIVSEAEWKQFQREVEEDNFGHSQEVHAAWMSDGGPCAFLFAETALDPDENLNHDYLGISEVVDFIAQSFNQKYRADLRERHRAATKPCLVKFSTPAVSKVHLGATIGYLVYKKAEYPLVNVTPCFSAEGKSIHPCQIEKVIPIHQAAKHGLMGRAVYSPKPPALHIHYS